MNKNKSEFNKEEIDADFEKLNAPISMPDLAGNEVKYITDCVNSGWISSQGKYVKKFEKDFSAYTQSKFGIAVMNGTVALHLALLALGIGEDDEVILPDLTFAATINAVLYVGAKPVIVDVGIDDWCISPVAIEKAITTKTKAIIPVHLYGQVCNMDIIMELAREYHLKVIEDCAEAHGAEFNGQKVGTFGDIGCFSFFANKIITTGEGGMCVTNSESLAEELSVLRDHGMSKTRRYWHEKVGYNYRLTNLQAAIGCAQLENISSILKKRDEIENLYIDGLQDIKEIFFQSKFEKRKKVTWLTSVLLSPVVNREVFIKKMSAVGIDIRPFFYPLSTMPIYSQFSNEQGSPVALELSQRGINLPTMTCKNSDFYATVISQIRAFFCQTMEGNDE
ncbi:MAG: DegT/DnrJ/EryC1/StrS family aminotransferase [Acetobacterium sp.]|uniref:DegT/DnrJ/EryC1/StrS family aminotransferase n=1 Tax=Acetobacterium sp. TaxID=1872094 RepID=UPI003242C66C